MRFDWMVKKPKKLRGLMLVRDATSTRVATTAARTRRAMVPRRTRATRGVCGTVRLNPPHTPSIGTPG